MLLTLEPPLSLLKCLPPLGWDHEHSIATNLLQGTKATLAPSKAAKKTSVMLEELQQMIAQPRCWKIFHSVELVVCLSLITGTNTPQVLTASKIEKSLSLMGSYFPSFTVACKMLFSLTRYSWDWLFPPFQISLLYSGCNVVYKEKYLNEMLQWSLPKVQ